MNSGKLRHRVAIERQSEEQDALGQRVDEWDTIATVWAQIEDLRGREITESGEVVLNETTSRIRLRHRLDVAPEMRAVELCHAQRMFNVTAVRYLGAPRPETLLDAEEMAVEAEVAS